MNTINYKEFGYGRSIYFIHGNSLNLESMITFYEPFFEANQAVKRIYLDIPGMGDSPLHPDISNSNDILNEIHSFISKHSKDENFSLCGHSYGGYLCLGLSTLFPTQIDKLFLTCPVVKARQKDRILEKHKNIVLEKVIPTHNKEYFEDFLAMNVQINNHSWSKYQQAIVPGLNKGTDLFWDKIAEEDYLLSFETILFEKLPTVSCIVLLGEYDQVVGYKNQHELMSDRQNFEVVLLPNCGHNLPIDDTESLYVYFQQFITH